MLNKEKLINIIYNMHLSDKTSYFIKNNKTIVLKVINNCNKSEIKKSIQKLFNVKVLSVKTLLTKKKKRRINKNNFSYTKIWKKAYVILKKNYNLNSINNVTL
ncbi:50S ribosomal protein L23 [Enterobacterales bacterium endosymbiont of Anomoneura mori]|uniref:50S ribosomal protein L23 n=1 Tax=Enterobacterales bacterium endosymbiont of Anomoneura mori TaxID=3132096 RepID=UPI00399C9AD0